MESIERRKLISRRDLTSVYGSRALVNRAGENTLTWEQAVRVLKKNQRFVLLVASSLICATIIFSFLLKNEYQPKATINVDPIGSGIKTLHEIEESSTADTPDYLDTQAQILEGQGLAIGVIRTLHLDKNPEFVTTRESAQWGGSGSSSERGLQIPKDSFLQDQLDVANRTALESMALTRFEKKLSVKSIRNSRLIEVSFASHDPQLAQAVTNTLVTQFIEQNYRNRYTTTMEASAWLSKQLEDLRKKVEASNQAVADYQRKYELVETDEKDVPLGQLMGDVNHQYSEAEANRIELEAYVRMINEGNADAVPAVREDHFYQNVMSRLAEVHAELAQARAVYGDENSNVKKLEEQVKQFAQEIADERTRILDRLHTSYGAARDREALMLKSREKLRSQMGDASSRMVAYRVLKNEATADAELYNTLQSRLKEAGIYAGLRSSNIHIVDLAARLYNPTSPHRGTIIAMGSILSCLFAVGLAFVKESMVNTARTPDDLQDWIDKPTLAMLPRMKPDSSDALQQQGTLTPHYTVDGGQKSVRILRAHSHSPEVEAIRDLRTALLFSNPVAVPRVTLVCSPSAGEGKTTVCINLAMALARGGKTCLIDGDLRQQGAGRSLGMNANTGLTEVLLGKVALSKAVVDISEIPLFSLLPAGVPVADPGDLIDIQRMQQVVDALKESFTYIVIDSPPLIPFADARLLASVADSVILVGRYGMTTRRAITRCVSILDQVNARIAGVVLNDIDVHSADYHYYNYGFSSRKNSDMAYYYENSLKVEPESHTNGDGPTEQTKRKSAGA
jgi:succinoglycan biosynthesis transport protein ExoP